MNASTNEGLRNKLQVKFRTARSEFGKNVLVLNWQRCQMDRHYLEDIKNGNLKVFWWYVSEPRGRKPQAAEKVSIKSLFAYCTTFSTKTVKAKECVTAVRPNKPLLDCPILPQEVNCAI